MNEKGKNQIFLRKSIEDSLNKETFGEIQLDALQAAISEGLKLFEKDNSNNDSM